jgi:hypothetical protein
VAAIFISHANGDRASAHAVAEWLRTQGFEDLFLDFDHSDGIPIGAEWEQEIYDKLRRSHLLVVLVSEAWSASRWCFTELCFARQARKPVIPIVLQTSAKTPTFERQGVRWDAPDAKSRLGAYLRDFSLQIHGGFRPVPGRPPFPGLRSFDENDAAFLFGRDEEIAELFKALALVSAARDPALQTALAVIGPSGSGKSSLVRAGLLPRLRRAVYHGRWRVGRAIRPLELDRHDLANVLANSGLGPVYNDASEGERPTRLVTIDQFEEVLALTPAPQAQFLDTVAKLLTEEPDLQLLLTVRSDSIGSIQKLDVFRSKLELFGVAPLALDRFPDVIKGPASLSGIEPDEALIKRIVADARNPDALPLLAFAIRQIYDFDPGARRWSVGDYERLSAGGDTSPLDEVVTKVANEAIKGATQDELNALQTVITTMIADINERGEHVRQVALERHVPAEARRVVNALVDARILVRATDKDDATIEVAHEAVLRVWPLARDWLREANAALNFWSNLRRAATHWMRADMHKQFLLHGNQAYESVAPLLPSGPPLDHDTLAYLTACATSYDEYLERRHRERGGALFLALMWTPLAAGALYLFQIFVAPRFGALDVFQLVLLVCILALMASVMRHYGAFASKAHLHNYYEGAPFDDLAVSGPHEWSPEELTQTTGVAFALQSVIAAALLSLGALILWADLSALNAWPQAVAWGNTNLFAPLASNLGPDVAPLMAAFATMICVYILVVALRWHVAIWDFFWDLIGRFHRSSRLWWAHTFSNTGYFAGLIRFELATPRSRAPRPIRLFVLGAACLLPTASGLIAFVNAPEAALDGVDRVSVIVVLMIGLAAAVVGAIILLMKENGHEARLSRTSSAIQRWLISLLRHRRPARTRPSFDVSVMAVLVSNLITACAAAVVGGICVILILWLSNQLDLRFLDLSPLARLLETYYARSPQTAQIAAVTIPFALLLVAGLVVQIVMLVWRPTGRLVEWIARPISNAIASLFMGALTQLLASKASISRSILSLLTGPSVPAPRIGLWIERRRLRAENERTNRQEIMERLRGAGTLKTR